MAKQSMICMPFQVVSIHGVPRSGTSWLGQLFASHPDVAYRHQPLFAYRFKDRLNVDSTPEDVRSFLQELYEVTDDPFILDDDRRQSLPDFWRHAEKKSSPSFLVMKMVRYHHLLPLFLSTIQNVKIIGIIRHPCAVINSWLKAPKEFLPGWNIYEEWRYAPKKNAGRIEEFNGFEKWKEVATMFMKMEKRYPKQFYLVQYEHLVENTEAILNQLFQFSGLSMHPQTSEFIRLTKSHHNDDPYAICKRPGVHHRWKHELDPVIVHEILQDVLGTPLERFLI